jgi:2',3'-cyclic-nucleotide 2'-phosphodiesterase (5'-nucleotidase family)
MPRRLASKVVVAAALTGTCALAGCSSSSTPHASDAGHPADARHDATRAPDSAADSAAETGAPDRHVVVLFTSDEHSHLLAFSPELDDFPESTTAGTGALVGGISRRQALLTKQRAIAKAAGKDSILVSAGDNNMGTLSHVAFQTDSLDYRSLQTLGYDVTTLGNHEFDFGPAALANAITVAQAHGGLPPIVASNIHFGAGPGDDSLQALYSSDVTDDKPIHPYRVLTTASGVKVGILGYVGVVASSEAPNKTPVEFSEARAPSDAGTPDASALAIGLPYVYEDLQPVVDRLRDVEKVDLVVALGHAGIADPTTQASIETGEDWQICQNVTGIDLIVSGHAHDTSPVPMKVTNKAGKPCLALNGSAFGQHVGYVDFTIPGKPGAPVTWDTTTQTLLPVNDTTVPDEAVAASIPGLVQTIEESGSGPPGETYLEGLLSLTTGTPVKNDPAKPGDLYFYPVGRTGFDVTDKSLLVFLSADAMLVASDAWAAENPPDAGAGDAGQKGDGGVATSTCALAVETAGVIRASIEQGKTGVIAAADAFDVVPLGSSPTNGTVGYPLIRAYLYLIEVQGVFEFSRSMGPLDADYNLGMGGAQVEYDATLPLVENEEDLIMGKGQVMKITIASDHKNLENFDKVIYQRAVPTANPPVPAIGEPFELIPVVTSSYVAEFAGQAGVSLKDSTGAKLGPAPYTNTGAVIAAVLHRPDGSEIKQLESFFEWIHSAPTLPAVYDSASPSLTKRWICVNGC